MTQSNGICPLKKTNAHLPKVLLASMSGSYGGMEVRMQQDAELLRLNGWRPAVSTPRFPQQSAWHEQLEQSGVELLSLPYPYLLEEWRSRYIQKLKALLTTIPALRFYGFDLAHIFLCWTTYGLGMLWALARAEIPTMVSVHNAFPMTEFPQWHRAHLKGAFATTTHVIAVSASALRHFLELYAAYLPETTITQVIPNPVDTQRFRPRPEIRVSARQRLGLPPDAVVIGSVGRLDKQKQPWKLIDTLAALHLIGVPAHLALVGQGILEVGLRTQAAKLGLSDYVVFTGHVHDVENLYPAFDLHLLLSRNEGFGIVTAEAMAAGVPALGSDVPGTRDVLYGTTGGALLRFDDPSRIARQIAEILLDEDRLQTMTSAAPSEIHGRFGRELVEAQLMAAYKASVAKRNLPC